MLDDDAVVSVLSDINYNKIYEYQGGWQVPVLFDYRVGYWIQVNATQKLTVYGLQPQNVQNTTVPGWNLVGYPNLTSTTVAGYYNGSMVYGYDGTWSSYRENRTQNSLAALEAGSGYWVLN